MSNKSSKPGIVDSYAERFKKKNQSTPLKVNESRIDPFFSDQPPIDFIESLKEPVHIAPPPGFSADAAPEEGQISCKGIYIKDRYPHGADLLDTAYADFERFAEITGIGGREYPISFVHGKVEDFESYRISVADEGITVTASDTEGIRRAIVYIEGELTKNEGPVLNYGDTTRRSYVKTRITRGFFSPTNRAPKFGDELLDDIEYYPDEYLNRLAHSNTNGLWIYTSFRALVKTDYFDDDVEKINKRINKLARVVAKCKKYGVGVYVFAIEPMGLLDQEHLIHPEFAGAQKRFQYHPNCLRSEPCANYVAEATEKLFRAIPDLAGYIDITAGERPTNCASGGNYRTCPRCRNYSRGENLAFACDKIKEGIRRAGTGAKFISWTYGHRYWDYNDIEDYIKNLPGDITVMQNFEDRGYNEQLGKPRVAYDYWLSYPGPSTLFDRSAEMTKKYGRELYAKMQVVTSHEIATVPYIPAPGLVFRKYKGARELGVRGVMECWYFGNYPSVMSRASGELSFREDMTSKEEFLLDFAARVYGKTMAPRIAAAWAEFEEGYFHYPTNIMFSYYGPMHDGVVWELSLIPKNNPLSRSWQLIDKPNGDRIGECHYRGHTLEELIALNEIMAEHWLRGMELLPGEAGEVLTVAECIEKLIDSSKNILNFYRLRGDLGRERGDGADILSQMRQLVLKEKANSERMIELCENDPRLGYHSEAEGFKFFPKKLRSRIASLEKLLNEEFPIVEARLSEGKHALGYYFAEGESAYVLGSGKSEAIGDTASFCASVVGDRIKLDVLTDKRSVVKVYYEFEPGFPEPGIMFGLGDFSNHDELANTLSGDIIFHPSAASHESVVDENERLEIKKYEHITELRDDKVLHTVYRTIPTERWSGTGAIKMNISVDGDYWINSDSPTYTLGKEEQSPDEYGFLIMK